MIDESQDLFYEMKVDGAMEAKIVSDTSVHM